MTDGQPFLRHFYQNFSLAKLFSNIGLQTLIVLTCYVIVAPSLSLHTHQLLYTISIAIKDMILWLLPLVVCFFIAYTISSFKSKAPLFILTLITFEMFSNFLSVSYAYLCATLISAIEPEVSKHTLKNSLDILWHLPLKRPFWWSAEKGSMVGVLWGLIASYTTSGRLSQLIQFCKHTAEWVMTRFFSRLIPIFVLGFVAKIYTTHMLSHLMAHYLTLSIYLIIGLYAYIILLFFIGSRGLNQTTVQAFKNIMPAGGIALLSSCSLSTLPWTIRGAEKNLRRPELAKAIIPATTNIQQVGDCFSNAFLCFLIYRAFNGVNPDLIMWLKFSFVFVLARFATAAVIGGAIFLMIPIYETYLGFNAEMIGLILALNVILDPLITSSNVVGNGALCRIFEMAWSKIIRQN